MNKNNLSRRQFLTAASFGTTTAVASGRIPAFRSKKAKSLAILGGQPVRTESFPPWPVWDEKDEKLILSVLRTGKWSLTI